MTDQHTDDLNVVTDPEPTRVDLFSTSGVQRRLEARVAELERELEAAQAGGSGKDAVPTRGHSSAAMLLHAVASHLDWHPYLESGDLFADGRILLPGGNLIAVLQWHDTMGNQRIVARSVSDNKTLVEAHGTLDTGHTVVAWCSIPSQPFEQQRHHREAEVSRAELETIAWGDDQ